MAEAFLREFGGEYFSVESAGLEAGSLNPVVVEAMREVGIDISQQKTDLVDDLIRANAFKRTQIQQDRFARKTA
jgi:arsenate reductase